MNDTGGRPVRPFHLSPPQTISLGFAAMIATGTLLLSLPIASQNGQSVGLVNALFTATSANCVTGLVVADTFRQWTVFGQVVILLLIQLGGLGLTVLLTAGMVVLRRRISLQSRLVVQAAFNQDNTGGMVRLVQLVLRVTLTFELAGAVLLALGFLATGQPLGRAVYNGVFHSISAFCNAGFDILGSNSLIPYQTNPYFNFIIMALIVAGGLGFTVWGELLFLPKRKQKKRHRPLWLWLAHLSLHAKMAVIFTAGLLVLGTGCFLLFEWGNPGTLGPLSIPQKVMAALFQSVTLRTAGFCTIPQGGLTEPSVLASSLLMFIGGSPAGTAGGIKTLTLAIVFFTVWSALRGRSRVEAMGRTLPMDLLQKALTVTGMLLLVVILATSALVFTEANSPFEHSLLDLLFEACSAAGTVGLTTGITPHLSTAGKITITLCMFLGRLSPMTVVVSLNMRRTHGADGISYPEERVIIG